MTASGMGSILTLASAPTQAPDSLVTNPLVWLGFFLAVVFLFVFIVAVIRSLYKRCPSNRILVIYGKVGAGKAARCKHGGGALIIPLIQSYAYLTLEPLVIVLTHCHIDHIAGLFQARSAFPEVPIWVHSAEEAWLSDPMLNLSALSGMPVTGPDPSRLLRDNETLDLLDEPWEVRHTPGHSPGSVSLVHHASNQVLAGDALFTGSIGRTDFPGCDFDTLANSIRTRLYDLPDETTVYPGHGPSTTIGREKRTNPFVRPQ